MPSLNKVMLIGRVGKGPVVKKGQYGSFCTLSIATDASYTSKSGEKVEKTEWHNVSLSGKNAENAEKYLQKGRLVYIEGSLTTRKWNDNGVDKYVTEIKANSIQYLSKDESETRITKPQQENRQSTYDDPFASSAAMDDVPF